tara:strand:- start:2474 stop:3061 length:588 start_codon:yes stop_codon:yes gene_type:complete
MMRLLIFFLFIGCSGTINRVSYVSSQKSYLDLLNDYKSCSGQGLISYNGYFRSRMSFNFKSQRDSTFLQFTDLLGRKTFLMWITPKKIIVRDMIENKHYNFDQIITFFPLLKILKLNDITKIVWGVIPSYNKNDSSNKSVKLKFNRKKLGIEKRALADIRYEDKDSNQFINIDFKQRKRINEFVDLKRFWKLLKY